jgi:hypothetical protein
MKSFEIGVVYRCGRCLGVAFATDALLTFRKGEPSVIHPRSSAEAVRGITVDGLCDRWGVTLEEVDAALAERLPRPRLSSKGLRSSRKGRESKLERQKRAEDFKRSKLVRITRA